jgi:hypothetical protein
MAKVVSEHLVDNSQGELDKDVKTDPPCHPRACAIQSMQYVRFHVLYAK